MHAHLATSTDRPCSACQHFGHWVAGTAAVWCLHGKIVNGMPQHGCAYWQAKEENPLQPKPEGANVRPT